MLIIGLYPKFDFFVQLKCSFSKKVALHASRKTEDKTHCSRLRA